MRWGRRRLTKTFPPRFRFALLPVRCYECKKWIWLEQVKQYYYDQEPEEWTKMRRHTYCGACWTPAPEPEA